MHLRDVAVRLKMPRPGAPCAGQKVGGQRDQHGGVDDPLGVELAAWDFQGSSSTIARILSSARSGTKSLADQTRHKTLAGAGANDRTLEA